MLGGMVDASYQSWVNASWDWTDRNRKTSYYDSEIQLLCKMVASGNWWKPLTLFGWALVPTASRSLVGTSAHPTRYQPCRS
jgi:hypothetical protein